MITLTPQMKIYLATEVIDFRKGIDGLVGLCRNHFNTDPFSGGLYIFRNRRGCSLKLLVYDGQGFWLCQKRLSKGRFRWWPEKDGVNEKLYSLLASEVQVLLWNGNPEKSSFSEPWKKIA
jgi:transposase